MEFTSELIQESIKNGFFALLFVSLLVWTILENRKRESSYQNTIKSLNENIASTVCRTEKKVDETIEEIDTIKEDIVTIDKKVDVLSAKVDGINNRI